MVSTALLEFIKEARRRGFDDYQIRDPLLKKDWPAAEVDEAFYILREKAKKISNLGTKTKIEIYLDNQVLKMLERRAKRNLFSLNEQIEDILRRSCSTIKKNHNLADEKLDDSFITIFSRRKNKKNTV
jgi:hypothetical protein